MFTANKKHVSHSGVLFATGLSLVIVVASVSSLNLALSEISVQLHATNKQLTWIIDSYTVALAALVLPFGSLGDRLGRKKFLLIGNIGFGAAALGCAFIHTPELFIVLRSCMGVAAAMIMPGTLSTITDTFEAEDRIKGVSIWSGLAAAGAVIGMVVAGILMSNYSWVSLQYTSAASAALAALSTLILVPETREKGLHHRFDYFGSLCIVVFVGSLIYYIIDGNTAGWFSLTGIIFLTICIASSLLYYFYQKKRVAPLLELRYFRIRIFNLGAFLVFAQFVAVLGFFYIALQYLELIRGYSALKSAFTLLPIGVFVLPVSAATPWFCKKFGTAPTMIAGLSWLIVGLFWLSHLSLLSTITDFMIGSFILATGIGISSTCGTNSILHSMSEKKQGLASAVNDVTREVGAAVGIALIGSVFARSYTHYLGDLRPYVRSAIPFLQSTHQYTPQSLIDWIQSSAPGAFAIVSEMQKHKIPGSNQLLAHLRTSFMDAYSVSVGSLIFILFLTVIYIVYVYITARQQQARKNNGTATRGQQTPPIRMRGALSTQNNIQESTNLGYLSYSLQRDSSQFRVKKETYTHYTEW